MHAATAYAPTVLPGPPNGCALLLPIPSRRAHDVHHGAYVCTPAPTEAALPSLLGPNLKHVHSTPQHAGGLTGPVEIPAVPPDFDVFYSLGDMVGAGSQSFVYACQLRMKEGVRGGYRHLEEKTLCVKHMLEEAASAEALDTVMKLDHPNVVRHYCVYRDARGLWVVMDYIQGPELLTRLLRNGGRFPEVVCRRLCRQIMSAIECVHTEGLVHCDIKLENFVVINEDTDADAPGGANEQISVALVDFGSAEVAGTRRRSAVRGASSGTLMYLAPERFSDAPADAKGDMWAAGILLCILLTGKPFFGELEFPKCMDRCRGLPKKCTSGKEKRGLWDDCAASRLTFKEQRLTSDVLAAIENRIEETFCRPEWLAVSLAAKKLVRRLLCSEPSKRLSATEALKDPWLLNQVDTLI